MHAWPARATLVEATASYERAVSLVERKLAAKAQLDTALAVRDEAEAFLDSANEELLRLTNGTRQEQLDAGAAVLQAAQGRISSSRSSTPTWPVAAWSTASCACAASSATGSSWLPSAARSADSVGGA